MTAQEYLEQYLRSDHSIRDLLEERQRWEALALRITPSYGPVTAGNKSGVGRIQTSVEQIEEWEQRLDEAVARQIALRAEIEKAIGSVENGDCRTLLWKRYILGHTWERIAEEMHYSLQWVFKLHKKALDSVKEAIKSDTDPVI